MSARNQKNISYEVYSGHADPLGVSHQEKFWNFAIFSEHAEEVSLCLFLPGSRSAYVEIPLDPLKNKTGWIWHIALKGDLKSLEYGYRLNGKAGGFDPSRVFLDPYAHTLNTPLEWGSPLKEPILGVILPEAPFDWEGDTPPNIPLKDVIIYEMHVRGFTIDPSSRVHSPGTFLGLIEKIPHLKSLGINAVELMPIFEFDECEIKIKNPVTGDILRNVWGYSTINFFTPMHRYAKKRYHAFDELRLFVRECHKHGIEVYLDVVYNHTGEGKIDGPAFSFKGIDRSVYYMHTPEGAFQNFSGTGNTLNCNHPVVMQLILDSLRFWTIHAHIDGFRFDLVSVLTRDEKGEPMKNPPIIDAMTRDPILAHVKLIAEAWDAGGLYQVGTFPGQGRWFEWNGKYRDSVRKFLKGTDGCVPDFAAALSGSSKLYEKEGGTPCQSINFITAHDGYTLRDLVSYQQKHNFGNGENNQDGANDNESWNCGAEGETEDPAIISLRNRQMRNFLVALFVSIGTPMLLMGDEYTHTRLGNNNPWCQDNALNFFLWDELIKNKEWFQFCQNLISLRKTHDILRRSTFLTPQDIDWHGIEPFKPNWDSTSRFIAYTLKCPISNKNLYIAFNAGFKPVTLTLPPSHQKWYLILDTSLDFSENFSSHPPPLPSEYTLSQYGSLVAESL